MLHQKADARDADPAAKPHEDGLAAGFHQFYQVGVQSDGAHGHDDEKFGEFFGRAEDGSGDAERRAHGGDHRGQDEEQDKKRENLFE